MFSEEFNDFAQTVLPALAIPIVITAWIIHTVSNRIAEYLCGEEDNDKK